jgi:hypothetical protein
MRRIGIAAGLAAMVGLGTGLQAQLNIAEIPFDAVEALQLTPDVYIGEAAGVATNSQGDIFVYTRTGSPHLTAGARNAHGGEAVQFDRTGSSWEIGQGVWVPGGAGTGVRQAASGGGPDGEPGGGSTRRADQMVLGEAGAIVCRQRRW